MNITKRKARWQRWAALFGVQLIVLSLFISNLPAQTAEAYGGRTVGSVVAFYYPWYDSRDPGSWWDRNKMSSLPAPTYESGDLNFVRGQMQRARDNGVDSFAVTWNGPSGDWANRFKGMLDSVPNGFTVSVHYETTLADTSVAATINNLKFIKDNYTNNPNYLHHQGKPVIFVWRAEAVQGGLGSWDNIRNQVDPNREMLWSADGVNTGSILQYFDAMHVFSGSKFADDPTAKDQQFRNETNQVAARTGQRKYWIAGVTPGYDDRKLRSPGEFRDREGGNYYRRSWNGAIASNPDLVTISTWNEWYEGSSIESGEAWGNAYLDLTKEGAGRYKGSTLTFGDGSISKVWNRTDLPVITGQSSRSWIWGPENYDRKVEPYAEGPGGRRLVYYFDKSRMEITRPTSDPDAQFFVTNGLLVREMMRGQIQTGDNREDNKGAAGLPVAGDYSNNPTSPTYASMAGVASLADDKKQGQKSGPIIDTMAANGSTGQQGGLAQYGATYAYFEGNLAHNIASPFWNFFQQTGPIVENGNVSNGQVVDWVFAMGYPMTEPYWCKVRVGGQERDVLVQAFERRIMTYTPSNPAGFQVEMGNVGRQYYLWRYGR